MSYGYHSFVWYYPFTGFNAPLYPSTSETGYLATLNLNYSANYWLSKGMPREKIVVGIPLYGQTYKLSNPQNHELKASAKGYGESGSGGSASYPQICQFLKNGAVRVFANDSLVPYAYKSDEWISYDDVTSVTLKV